jgi:type I restriction-modification system DNA methylase subunit
MSCEKRVEFGDFQTPDALAIQVTQLVKQIFPVPSVVVEPTCGLGSFLAASLQQFGEYPQYYGFDINEKYLSTVRYILKESIFLNRLVQND